jgi:hypothetical protein
MVTNFRLRIIEPDLSDIVAEYEDKQINGASASEDKIVISLSQRKILYFNLAHQNFD